mgnify:CR=1 FL=1
MGKVKRSKAAQKALESRVLLFLSDKRLADNSFEILSGIQTYYKDVYFCLATSDCTEARLAIDSQDSSKRTDLFEQFEQKLIELCYLLGSLRDLKQTLDLVGNGYGSSRIVTEFSRMSEIYGSFLKYEKETCKIVSDIWNLVQVLDASSLIDHDDYSTYMSNLYEKIEGGFDIRNDFSEDNLYIELKSLAEKGSCKATYLCEGLEIASRRPVTPRALIERVGYAFRTA